MIPTIIIITIAFYWLLRESEWLTIRLTGAPELKSTSLEVVIHSLPLAQPVLLLPEVCERTRLQREYDKLSGGKYKDSWIYGTGYRQGTSWQKDYDNIEGWTR